MSLCKFYCCFLLIVGLFSCKKDNDIDIDPIPQQMTECELTIIEHSLIEPTTLSPLCAKISLTIETDCVDLIPKVTIKGAFGSEDYSYEVDLDSIIPIYALYENHLNEVELKIGEHMIAYSIQTADLLYPNVTVNKTSNNDGFILSSCRTEGGRQSFCLDKRGNIRWALDMSESNDFQGFGNHLKLIKNGKLAFGTKRLEEKMIFELDYFGETSHVINNSEWQYHHDLVQKPDGNYIVLTEQRPDRIFSDIIEIDRNGNVINVWNPEESLKSNRFNVYGTDWIHLNSVWYDEFDNSIVISGAHGVCAKLSAANEVIWILAPHSGWQTGWETEFQPFLLQPIDFSGLALSEEVTNGYAVDASGFDWPWLHHSAKLYGDKLIIFDNGNTRNFKENGDFYSRIVEYQIDEQNKTIRQTFEFGKDRPDLYSSIVSTTEKRNGNYLMCSGVSGHILEVNANGSVEFEVHIEGFDNGSPAIFYSGSYFDFPIN